MEKQYLNSFSGLKVTWKYGAWKIWFQRHGVEFSGRYYAWTYHLGPLKIMFGYKEGERLQATFEDGLRTGLSFDEATREWMRNYRNK